MTVTATEDPDRPGVMLVQMSAGEPFAMAIAVDPAESDATAALFTALRNRTWLAQVRDDPASTGDPVAVLTKTESVNDDGVLVILFELADSSALLPDRTYYADARCVNGPAAGSVWCAETEIAVIPTVSK